MKPVSARDGKKKRVVIVDDSTTMQALLDQVFSLKLGIDVVGIASNVETAVPMIRSLRPDLVTIDLCMPYIDGLKLLDMIADMRHLTKIVVSTRACANLALVSKLKEAGADACIDKMGLSRDPEAFCGRIRGIMIEKKCAITPTADKIDRRPVAAPANATCANDYPIPFDEKARLAALARMDLANDDVDHQLDLLTAHLGVTTDFPTCLITFIDRDRQWIKSAHGFERGFTKRATAFCNYTICGDEPLIVPNAAIDKRFANNILVTGEPGIRTYVGCPIITRDGVHLGAICLIDTEARRVAPSVIANLRSISRIAAEFIDLRSGYAAKAA